MAHTGIFATSDEILTKAGANYSTGVTEARINALCLQAEGYINVVTQKNFSDAYGALNADVKSLLGMVESDIVAAYIISYNMSGYTSRAEAQTMLDLLWASASRGLAVLKQQANRDWMVSA